MALGLVSTALSVIVWGATKEEMLRQSQDSNMVRWEGLDLPSSHGDTDSTIHEKFPFVRNPETT
jgi:hypothetical protein